LITNDDDQRKQNEQLIKILQRNSLLYTPVQKPASNRSGNVTGNECRCTRSMENFVETALKQFRRRKHLQDYRFVILFFLSASLIQYSSLHTKWRKLDERLEIINYDDTNGVFRNDEQKTENEERSIDHLATRTDMGAYDKKRIENNTDFGNVVDSSNFVQINGNESFLWQGAQSRLCTHIKKKRKQLKSQKNLHLNLVIKCGDIDERNQHGNFMIGFYAMKLAAIAFQADFTFRCLESERKDYILWWLQSQKTDATSISTAWTAAPDNEGIHYLVNNTLYTPSQPTPDVACRGMGHVALHYTSEYVRKDMRAMAVKLLPSMKSKGMIIDEVAIHLRCGDIISKNMSPKDKNYGLVQFQAYRKRIPSSIKSIGIVTAPFSEKNRRKQDLGSGHMCRALVLELVDYLESSFPKVKVRVRNNPNETIPEVVSRLILAKYNFCVRSTFCLLPSIASYGTSYVQKGGTAYFVDDVSKVYDNIEMMDEPFLFTRDIRERGFNSTLKWLTES
jgi:hypothetical protein